MKKIFMFGICIMIALVLATIVSAAGENFVYYNGTDLVDVWGNNDLTKFDGIYSTEYPTYAVSGTGTNGSFEFDEAGGDEADIPINGTLANLEATDFSISMWVKINAGSSDTDGLWYYGDGNEEFSLRYLTSGNNITWYAYDTTAQFTIEAPIEAGNWYYVVATYRGDGTDNASLWINGTEIGEDTSYTCSFTNPTYHNLGRYRDLAVTALDGFIDEVKIFDHVLTGTEITNLYNCNDNTTCAPAGASCTNMTITAADVFSAAVSSYQVNVSYNGTTTTYSDSTGTVTTGICTEDQQTANVTFSKGLWYGAAVSNHNTSANYQFTGLHQARNIVIGATQIITNNTVSGATANIKGTTGTLFNLTAAALEVNMSVTGYYDKNGTSITFTAFEEGTTHYIEDMWQSELTVDAVNISSGLSLDSFWINLSGVNETYTNNTAATAPFIFRLIHGDYSVVVDAYNFTSNTSTVNVYSATVLHNVSLFAENLVNLTFYNEESGVLVNDRNISVELIGDDYSYNYTTETGSLQVDLLYPQSYTIRYDADEYVQRFYYFTLVDDSINYITLYMLNDSSATAVTARVQDEGSWPVEGAQIRMLRFDLPTNSYIIQEMCETNFEGTCVLHMELASEFYKFKIYYDSELKKETNPSVYPAATTEVNFQINLEDLVAENFFNSQGVVYTIIFDTANDWFRYSWDDTFSLASQGCIKVYRETAFANTLVNTSCASGTSGIVYAGVANETGALYKAHAFIYYNENVDEEYLGTLMFDYQDVVEFGLMGLLIVAILTIVFAFTGIWSPPLACIITPLPWVIARAANIIPLSWGIVITIEVVGIIIAVVISRHS